MIFRYARHTSDLRRIEDFYTRIVQLEKLGEFKNHFAYDGIFLGLPGADWHLEFTVSNHKPTDQYDDDDIIVFYVHSVTEMDELKYLLQKSNIQTEKPRNPYWSENGIMVSDPDGHNLIFTWKEINLTADDELTQLMGTHAVTTWGQLITHVQHLPYGRNENRSDFSLVMKEGKGTCSSKHAFLQRIAQLNQIENVKLILGMYKMNHFNTPKIGNAIIENGLDYIPEAHCYLKLNNRRIDITTSTSRIDNIVDDLLEEIEIVADQVNEFKVEYHKRYLKNWIEKENLNLDPDDVWKIREECIKRLGS